MLSLSGLISTVALGRVQGLVNVSENPEKYGYTLAGFLCIAYLGSVPLFLQAGRKYKEYKEKF
jgi:hypothetical protein